MFKKLLIKMMRRNINFYQRNYRPQLKCKNSHPKKSLKKKNKLNRKSKPNWKNN